MAYVSKENNETREMKYNRSKIENENNVDNQAMAIENNRNMKKMKGETWRNRKA